MSLDGVLANPNLVSFLNGLHGKQVLVETKAGQQFIGVFGASSPELEIGLTYAWMKTTENAKNVLPRKDEINEKMVFKFADVITVSAVWIEEKNIKGFATDRDYHSKTNGRVDDEELEVWDCDEEGDEIEPTAHMPDQKQVYQKNGGWSVDEMFNANSRLHGVQSTFAEDMSQYTTVDFEATEEGKAKADRIAREIEQNSRSNFYSRLENDDDERDLDKVTNEDDLDPGSKRRTNKGAFGNSSVGRNRNDRGAGNRRAEGLRGDRRGSGPQPQQQTPPRYSQGTYTPRGGQFTVSPGKRNSTGDDQFGGEWQNPPKEPSRPKDGGKVFENTSYKGRMERGGRGEKGRMDSLKQWGHEFSSTYKQSKQEDLKDYGEPASRHSQEGSSGNAWNNGPPVSLLSSQIAAPGSPSSEAQGTVSEEPRDVAEQMEQLNLTDEKQTDESLAEEKDKSEESNASKKFTFNPNAPAFTPRQQPPTTPTQAGSIQQLPLGMVSGVPMQGSLPPGMMVPTGQPMIGPWQSGGYVQVPNTPYQVYMPSQTMMGNVPMQGQRGNGVSQVGNYGNQPAQRRNGPGQQSMIGQWTNPVVVQPMGYYQYPAGAAQQGQQFAGNPQIVSQGQQTMPAQLYQQQRYPMGYMVAQGAQQPRYPVSQQGSHSEGNGQYPSSTASTTGPNSQPPTPGPQPPPVASPAQQPQATGRGSPAPPAAQQFIPQSAPAHAVGPQTQPSYYPAPPNPMYMYNQQGQVLVAYTPGQMPMSHSDGQNHPHMDVQPHQQYIAHESYGQYIPGPAYYQQQQPMSRQNSVPQSTYNGQPPSSGAPVSHQGGTTVPLQPASSTPSIPPQN